MKWKVHAYYFSLETGVYYACRVKGAWLGSLDYNNVTCKRCQAKLRYPWNRKKR